MADLTVGFCGKLPTNGDFIQRRVAPDFSQAWDTWLERCLHEAQTELRERWLDVYLAAPAWRFALAPGACGRAGLCGVLVPSMDKVGRHFPMTVVRTLAPGERVLQSACGDVIWFESVEALVLEAVHGAVQSLEHFDQRLQGVAPARVLATSRELLAAAGNEALSSPHALAEIAGAIAHEALAQKTKTPLTYWWTKGSDVLAPSFRWRAGLPQTQEFSRWLNDRDRVPAAARAPPASAPSAFGDLLGASVIADEPVARVAVSEPRIQAITPPASGLAPIDDPLALFGDAAPIQQTSEGSLTDLIAPEPEVRSTGWVETFRGRSELPAAITADSFVSAAISDRGKRRKLNQDAYLDAPQRQLWAVADGLGGWKEGDKAARMVVEALASISDSLALEDRVRAGQIALAEVNRQLHARADDLLEPVESGSTVVAMLALEDQLAFLWAGDSRAYRFRGGRLEQLTRDHSLVQAALDDFNGATDGDSGAIPDSVITRAVGAERGLELDAVYHSAQAGDRYLLCSDGLYRELASAHLQTLMGQGTPAQVCEQLLEKVLAGSASDNLTAIVIECRG